ncbi:amidohydrolase family protein [Saccharopolyspora taberi]|uniref:Amidohydrolase family protein n=1 Tax=Saccharopolyspora taberi TaxID=60895 RepID=A0ABN3VHC2_9PSEU
MPSGIDIVDGRGKTLLPGLIDAHVHAFGLRADPVRFGVTTELDMFTFLEHLGPYRQQRESAAPTRFSDVWTAGTLVTVPGGHGTEYGPIPTVSPDADREDVARFVRERLAEGSDYIKVIKDDGSLWGGHYPTLSDRQVEYAIEAAHEFGARCVVHVVRQRDARVALEAGADGLAHVPADPMPDDVVDLARRRGAFVIATLTVFNALSCAGEADQLLGDPLLAPYLSQEQRDGLNLRAKCKPGLFDVARENVRALHAKGVPVLVGTDAANPGTARGVSLLSELGLLVDARLSPVDALRSATGIPARRFGLEGRGLLAPGHRADLVLVNGDATENIQALRDIHTIWRNGIPTDRRPAQT